MTEQTISEEQIRVLIRETLIEEASNGNPNWGTKCLSLAMKRYGKACNALTVLKVAVQMSTEPDIIAEISERNAQLILQSRDEILERVERFKDGNYDQL